MDGGAGTHIPEIFTHGREYIAVKSINYKQQNNMMQNKKI